MWCFVNDFIDDNVRYELDKISRSGMKFPILYDKGSNRLYFLYYFIGCKGQYMGVEGLFATLLVETLRKQNAYLQGIFEGTNNSIPMNGDIIMEYEPIVAPSTESSQKSKS